MLCSEILFFYNSKCNILNLAFRVSWNFNHPMIMIMMIIMRPGHRDWQ